MTERKNYLDKIETQLSQWLDEVEEYKEALISEKSKTKVNFYNQLNALSGKIDSIQQNLEETKQAGSENWAELKSKLEASLAELQHDFTRVSQSAQKAGYEVLSWAKGMADTHVVESIGWAEGMAKEKKTESIGWAEGMAKEDPVESAGWVEGYSQKKQNAEKAGSKA